MDSDKKWEQKVAEGFLPEEETKAAKNWLENNLGALMLKKDNRLKKRYQFAYVYRAGSHVSGKHVVLYFTPSKTKNIKVGFAVTKKLGKAYLRNFIRRRLREIIYAQIPTLKQNFNLIVVAKQGCDTCNFGELEKEIETLLKKAELKNEKIL